MTDNIHTAMLAIMNEVSYIQKERSKDVGYTLKTENSVIQATRPSMLKHGVYMYPVGVKDVAHSQFEAGKYKNIWNRIVATHVYRFVHAESDTFIDVEVLGDGADTGDKAGNKSMTTSKKYALLEAFLLETGDDPDATPSNEMTRTAAIKPAKVSAPPVPTTSGTIDPQWLIDNQYSDNIAAAAKVINYLHIGGKPATEAQPLLNNYRLWRNSGLEPKEAAEKTLAGEVPQEG